MYRPRLAELMRLTVRRLSAHHISNGDKGTNCHTMADMDTLAHFHTLYFNYSRPLLTQSTVQRCTVCTLAAQGSASTPAAHESLR
jgi:hypothetical protein